MPDEALESVLRLLAEGRLTAEEAGPIIDALDDRSSAAARWLHDRRTAGRPPAPAGPAATAATPPGGSCASR